MVTLQLTKLDDPRVEPLLRGLTLEYEQRYGETDEMSKTATHEFDPPDGGFIVALDDSGATVAGGGFRRFDEHSCEIKRMWTAPTARRTGLASVVLAALEDAARAAGYTRVILETGPAQPEAHALYLVRGYAEFGNLGRYEFATAYAKSL